MSHHPRLNVTVAAVVITVAAVVAAKLTIAVTAAFC
jgi:hypothetical protein